MNNKANNSIAKNTIVLYIRMVLTMIISLYTSRVILRILGVEDYGIYQSVGGIVGFLTFINGALSTGTSRFLTYELGTGNFEKLKKVFSTTLIIHIIIAIIVAILAETIGLWFLYNKLVIPSERFDAAVYAFHISILTSIFTLTQVPYNASIISHEKMSIFAYMSLLEVSAKLGIVYLLSIGNIDKLKLYATLLFIIQISLMLLYRIYCTRNFKETKFYLIFDKSIFKEISSFSGWSLIANASTALNSQGVLILLNIFFEPAIVAARSISIQVNMAANQLVNNFRTAVNPQIVKRLAANDIEGSQKLLLNSTEFSYYLMMIICVPLFFLADPILHLWLVNVPPYATPFLQLILIQSLIQVFDTSFYTALYAKGRLKENALLSPTIGLIRFPIIYILFKLGYSPLSLSWACIVTYSVLSFIIKPYLIIKIAGYNIKDIYSLLKKCAITTLWVTPVPAILYYYLNLNTLANCIVMLITCLLNVVIIIWFIGLNPDTRAILKGTIKQKLSTIF